MVQMGSRCWWQPCKPNFIVIYWKGHTYIVQILFKYFYRLWFLIKSSVPLTGEMGAVLVLVLIYNLQQIFLTWLWKLMRMKNIVLEISLFYYCDAHHVTFTFLIKCCFLIYWPIFESTIATLQLSQPTFLKEITRDICHFFSTEKNFSSVFLHNVQGVFSSSLVPP